jgi:tetratricopeptide (TPR) repeat protein
MTALYPHYDDRLAQADAAYNALDLDAAVTGYREVLEDSPGSYEAELGLAHALTRLRDHEQARAAAERCIALAPERAEGYASLGVLQFLLDETAPARQSLEKALALAPDDPEARLTLAQVAADEGNATAADEQLARARQSIDALPAGQDHDALLALAWHAQTYLQLIAGNNSAAREAAQEVIALREANPYAACLAYSNLGILDAQSKNYDQAIEYLEQAFGMNPRFYRAASALGRILILRKQHERAAEVLAVVVAHPFSDQGMDRYLWAMALAKSGRRAEAAEQYRLALSAGLKGVFKIQALWQVVWQNQWGRYAVIGVGLLAVLLYVLLVRPDGSALSLLAVAGVILLMQLVLGRARR